MPPVSGLNHMKVLAVDDSLDVLALIKEILTSRNYEVDTADNGAMALDRYAKFKPDVVLLDIAMPVMDGIATLSRMLKLDKDANIIMVTALESEDIVQKCLQKGAIGYLTKPFSPQQLISAITNALQNRSQKNVFSFFALAGNKIELSLKKMQPGTTTTLKDVKVEREETTPQAPYVGADSSKIRAVPKAVRPREVKIPEGARAYVTELSGQQQGMIISVISEADRTTLTGSTDETTKMLEFFNIVNMKIFSELTAATGLALTASPTKVCEKAGRPSNEVAIATYEVCYAGTKMTIDVQLWFQLGLIFGSRF